VLTWPDDARRSQVVEKKKLTFGTLFPGSTALLSDRAIELRIGGSGVSGEPTSAPNTKAVVAACSGLGIPVETALVGSFGSGADMYQVQADFLDGGVVGETGNSIGGSRGVVVRGPRAIGLLCHALGVRLPRTFLQAHGLDGVSFEMLKRDLELDRAYRQTTFRADIGNGALELQIGTVSSKLQELLKVHHVSTWAFLTAQNPRSHPLPDDENKRANEALRLAVSGRVVFPGEGVSPNGEWREESFLVLGVSLEEADALAVRFQQTAFVFGAEYGAPRLVYASGAWQS